MFRNLVSSQQPQRWWNRRQALQGIGCATALTAFAASPACAQARREFSPEMFGARGDGRSDDYDALMELASAVTAAGGGTVRFGRGKQYLIDRIRIAGGPRQNSVGSPTFRRCRGLRIDLNGSTINVKGDFHRSGDARGGRISFSEGVIPINLIECHGVVVRNGTLNGNADRMSRDPKVVESNGHGLSIGGCRDVQLADLHVHHFPTDGVRLGITGPDRIPCESVRLDRVRLTNNGRQGLTNAGGAGVVATDCEFNENGRTGGTYGHSPRAGVDVEPMRHYSVRSDFRGVRCRFDNNAGAAVVAGNPDLIAFVELIDCHGRSPIAKRMILSAERSTIRGGTWHNIQIACAYAAHHPFKTQIAIDVSGGRWTGDDPEWFPIYDASPRRPQTRIHNNRFELRSPRPFGRSYMFLCANPNHRFEDNEIFVSRTGHDGTGPDLVGNFQGAAVVAGNRWSTDLQPPLRFVNNYAGAKRVERETFSGSFVSRGGG